MNPKLTKAFGFVTFAFCALFIQAEVVLAQDVTTEIRFSNKCVDIPGQSRNPGTTLFLYECNGGANQRFTFLANRQIRAYESTSNLCLEVGGTQQSGSPVQLATCDNARLQQRWTFRPNTTQICGINGGCFDINGADPATGNPVQVWINGWILAEQFILPGGTPRLGPELPREFINTSLPTQNGAYITVRANDNLQAVLNNANPGDTIVIDQGAVFTGNYTLRNRSGNGWIVIRSSSSAFDQGGSLRPGTRVNKNNAIDFASILTPNSVPALNTEAGAHNYRLIGLELGVSAQAPLTYDVVALGIGNETSLSQLPRDIVLDRVYVHGYPGKDVKRGIAMNSVRTALIDSYVSEIHVRGQDNATIGCTNGPGPYKITNNYLEASSQVIQFGGGDPRIYGLIPSDIEFRGNLLYKPLYWRVGDPSYIGINYTVKNIFELKSSQRVWVDYNIMQNNWTGQSDQPGSAIVLTPRNQDGNAPYSLVQDVTFTNNVVIHSAQGVGMLGSDYLQASKSLERVLFKNNAFIDIARSWGTSVTGIGISLSTDQDASGNGATQIEFDHNRFDSDYKAVNFSGPGNPPKKARNLVLSNNVFNFGTYGVFGDAAGSGDTALSTFVDNPIILRNGMIGGSTSGYSGSSYFPNTSGTRWVFCSTLGQCSGIPGSDGVVSGVDMSKLPPVPTN